jgi:pimeloyl-ACP methyl ester carboxylesterase
MIEDPRGRIDYEETGTGPTIVLVPGSCSTGAAWRPMMAQWNGRFRCVTTSLLGYGGTAERRDPAAPSIDREVEMMESVIRRAGGPVHLVGHSFGGSVALATAIAGRVPVASLSIVEAPLVPLLRQCGEEAGCAEFGRMKDIYFSAFHRGEPEAVAQMIDFYGGVGTFGSWPSKMRAYAIETTHVNITDWVTSDGVPESAAQLMALDVPMLVLWGSASPRGVQRANELLAEHVPDAKRRTISGAAHFMIATHAAEVAEAIAQHVVRADQAAAA